MVRKYEMMVVFDGTLPDETLSKEQAAIEALIAENGVLEKTDIWGKRSLAYPIRKRKTGYYILVLFEGEGDIPGAIAKKVKLSNTILRHLVLVRDPNKKIWADVKQSIEAREAAREEQQSEMEEERD